RDRRLLHDDPAVDGKGRLSAHPRPLPILPRPPAQPMSLSTASSPRPMARWLGVCLLLALAATFGANHVAARLAFDHGVNVTTAVAVRSLGTALIVLVLLRLTRTPVRIPAPTLRRGLAIGLLVAVQSWCLYSAVARIPVALALLV